MRRLPGVTVATGALCSRTVAPRWKGALGYLAAAGWACAGGGATLTPSTCNSAAGWPARACAFLWALRQAPRVHGHNAVPHGFTGQRHAPTERIARLARTLVFVSRFSRRRLHRPLRRGLSRQVEAPGRSASLLSCRGCRRCPTGPRRRPRRWSAGARSKPYKGVELFAELARSRAHPRDAGLGLEIHGAWAPELAGLTAELGARRAHRGRLPRRAAAAAAAGAQRRLPPAVPRGDPVGSAVLAAASRPRLLLHRRRRPRRLPAPLRPARRCCCASAAPMRSADALEPPATRPGGIATALQAARTPPPWATTNAGDRRRLRRRARGLTGAMPQSRGFAGTARPAQSPAVRPSGRREPKPPNCP